MRGKRPHVVGIGLGGGAQSLLHCSRNTQRHKDAGARESRCKRIWIVGYSIGGILAYPTNTVSHASMPRMHAADSEARPR